MNIAIIGAGLAGLTVATKLHQEGLNVTVFEKARGVGGRMATRYTKDFEFDFGAQFFIAKTQAFQDFLAPFVQAQVVQPWHATFAEIQDNKVFREVSWTDEFAHYVGTPRMTSLCKALAQELTIHVGTKIDKITQHSQAWALMTQDSTFDGFDWVILAIPHAQALALVPDGDFQNNLRQRKMSGCYSLMLGLTQVPQVNWQAALIHNSIISWVSMNSSKPSRKKLPSMVIHASNAWADANMSLDLDSVSEQLIRAASDCIGEPLQPIIAHQDCHRWRYANIEKNPLNDKAYIDSQQKMIFCGDWCISGRVESAFLSGQYAANTILKGIN